MGFKQGPQTIHLEEVHATALQKVLDMPNLPNTFTKQVRQVAWSYQKAAPLLVASATSNSVAMTDSSCDHCCNQVSLLLLYACLQAMQPKHLLASHVLCVVQIAQALQEPTEQRLKESKLISAISNRCASQSLADMLHSEGVPKYGRSWNAFVGDTQLYHDYPSDSDGVHF